VSVDGCKNISIHRSHDWHVATFRIGVDAALFFKRTDNSFDHAILLRAVQREHVVGQARTQLDELMSLVRRVLEQYPKGKNKLYALHAPEVECIAKGRARTPYEFGVKVSVATTHKEGCVVAGRAMSCNPYDGRMLAETLEQASILTHAPVHTAVVDRGYRGVQVAGVHILRSGLRRGT